MEVEQGGVAVPRFRYEPVSARLSLVGWLDVDVGVGFEQAVDAVELRAALCDGVAQAKGVAELCSEEECSVFNQKWPLCNERPAKHAPDQYRGGDPGGGCHAAQYVRTTALGDCLHFLLFLVGWGWLSCLACLDLARTETTRHGPSDCSYAYALL